MQPDFDIEQVAAAVEAELGHPLPGIRRALAELKQYLNSSFVRTYTPEQILMQQIRKELGLRQSELAWHMAVPLSVWRDWEDGRLPVPEDAVSLLRLLQVHPELVAECVL